MMYYVFGNTPFLRLWLSLWSPSSNEASLGRVFSWLVLLSIRQYTRSLSGFWAGSDLPASMAYDCFIYVPRRGEATLLTPVDFDAHPYPTNFAPLIWVTLDSWCKLDEVTSFSTIRFLPRVIDNVRALLPGLRTSPRFHWDEKQAGMIRLAL
ncbi:hypothetical protein PQX77_006655 [Marasmius sp. AFHP31]|nr:hypothetical protein PQX77_006655 [Marasmius sp. AFHP31]